MTTPITNPALRIGYGEDAHALEAGRPLIIGNILIPDSPVGARAHSDGDVLLHALADALLSTHALGDIGTYFPPSNPEFKDMNSADILTHVRALLPPFSLLNVAAVVTLDAPKLGVFRERMQTRVADLLQVDAKQVGVTFKTSEGLAPTHIQARVTLLIQTQATLETTQ